MPPALHRTKQTTLLYTLRLTHRRLAVAVPVFRPVRPAPWQGSWRASLWFRLVPQGYIHLLRLFVFWGCISFNMILSGSMRFNGDRFALAPAFAQSAFYALNPGCTRAQNLMLRV